MKRTLLSIVAVFVLTLVSYAQWDEQASGFSAPSRGITDIMAVDANVVWAVAYDGTNPTAACIDFTRTTNGGTLWTAGSVTGATGTSIACISAVSATKAWTCHYYPSGSGTKDGIYYTSDGGSTWTQQTSATFSNASSFPNCVWFWDENNGYCMGDPINGDFEIYTTTDGGNNWVLTPGANIPAPLSGEWGVVGYQSVVNNTVWFGTNKGRIYKSTDKGLNWTVSAITVSGWSSKYVEPRFKDEMNGIVMDKGEGTTGALVETSDGGTTWTAVTATGNAFTNDFAYVPGSPNTYVTTGADTENERAGFTYSWDGGHVWNDMTATLGTQFLATDWVNDSTGWAGAFNEDATTGGMYKFNGVLAQPLADFETADTALTLGSTALFTNLSLGMPTSYLWTFQGGAPGSSTQKNPPAILYNTPGDFDVTLRVTSEMGTNTLVKTGYIHVGGVGINDQTKANIMIYPNPVTDVVNIKSNNTIIEVQIFSMTGQVILTQKVNGKNISLNTSSITGGVYNLKVVMEDGYINKKIVVN